MRPLTINGKFLSAGPTGVHRAAEELVRAIDAEIASAAERSERAPRANLLVPPDARTLSGLRAIETRTVPGATGQRWEQVVLPRAVRGTVLLNLCNLGPLAVRDALTLVHDAMFVTSPSSYPRAFRWKYRAFVPLLARVHRAVMTVSEHSRTELARLGICPPERCHVVHNGCDHLARAPIAHDALARFGLEGTRYVLALASSVPRKNVAVLLEAFARAAPDGARLALFGPDSRDALAAAGLAVPASTRVLGRVSDAELRALLRGAHAFAFPSLDEGFGLPPLEAMAEGCPTVVAPRAALPEVCADAALYADPHDAAEWSRRFAELEDPGRRGALVRRGRDRAARFDWGSSARRILELARRVDADGASFGRGAGARAGALGT